MEELLKELAPEWGEGRIFRPYRDIRFSSNKSPYKTDIAAVIDDGYVPLSADGSGRVGASGIWPRISSNAIENRGRGSFWRQAG